MWLFLLNSDLIAQVLVGAITGSIASSFRAILFTDKELLAVSQLFQAFLEYCAHSSHSE